MLNFVDQLSMNGSSVELEGDYVENTLPFLCKVQNLFNPVV